MTRYISLAEYFWLAEQVTGVEAADVYSPSSDSPGSSHQQPHVIN